MGTESRMIPMQLSISGYKSAVKYWPGVFGNVDSARKLRILAALARLRPVLVKGYESMVMVSNAFDPQTISAGTTTCLGLCPGGLVQ